MNVAAIDRRLARRGKTGWTWVGETARGTRVGVTWVEKGETGVSEVTGPVGVPKAAGGTGVSEVTGPVGVPKATGGTIGPVGVPKTVGGPGREAEISYNQS